MKEVSDPSRSKERDKGEGEAAAVFGGLASALLHGDEDDKHGLGERECVHIRQVAGGWHHVDEDNLVGVDGKDHGKKHRECHGRRHAHVACACAC